MSSSINLKGPPGDRTRDLSQCIMLGVGTLSENHTTRPAALVRWLAEYNLQALKNRKVAADSLVWNLQRRAGLAPSPLVQNLVSFLFVSRAWSCTPLPPVVSMREVVTPVLPTVRVLLTPVDQVLGSAQAPAALSGLGEQMQLTLKIQSREPG
ncbi:hypothetical protein VTK26DRAFT_4253 [Humicola hyalothermophila]